MKIAYITAHSPYGRGETFIKEEMNTILDLGIDLIILPRNPSKEVFHKSAKKLCERAIRLPLLNFRIFFTFLKEVFLCFRLWRIIGQIIRHSRTLKILVKNLAVLPKSVYIAGLFRKSPVDHVHAHWGSTTATMAWIISKLTAIPWSCTFHRWDIPENNLLKLKVEHASFVRCIDENGRCEVLQRVGEKYRNKVKVIHLGARWPEKLILESNTSHSEFVIACPANFVTIKGHRFLIEACALLVEKGIRDFLCLLIGDGPLEEEIHQKIAILGLKDYIRLTGRLPHEELLRMYYQRKIDIVVLPSIVTSEGDKEGIPVALMEAMAHGTPVIATRTGGIPELLSGGAGIMVKEKDANELADALEELMIDDEKRKAIGESGRKRVIEDFDLIKNTRKLLETIERSGR